MSKSFQFRLRDCLKKGNLRTADLARWFDRPHATVRGWAENGVEPGGGPGDVEHVVVLLGLLEVLIKKGDAFPVPRLSPSRRIKYMTEIRRATLP